MKRQSSVSGHALIETLLALPLLVVIVVALSQLFLLGMARLTMFHRVGWIARGLALGALSASRPHRWTWSETVDGQIVVEEPYLQRVLAPQWFPVHFKAGVGYVPGRVRGVSVASPHPMFRRRSYPQALPDG